MDRFDRGEHEFRGLIGAEPQDTLAELRLRSPQMYDLIVRSMGVTMAQAELSRTAREIATVAMLITIGATEPQLDLHTRAALRQGVTPAELIALCEHVAMYAGVPRALNGLTVIDRVLADEGFPRPAALRRVRLADHETFVAQRGETGEPVVLLHAIGLDWRMWESVMVEIADTRRVFAYDVRGHGLATGAPAARTMADFADDFVQVLDALELDRVHVVGLSFGGAVAQAVAVKCPSRVASVALLGTTDQPNEELFESRALGAEKDGMTAQVPMTLTRWFTADALAVNDWAVQYARERLIRGNVADWASSWRVFKTLDVQGKLDSIKALVVAGEVDVAGPPEAMRALAGRIPGAEFEVLPGAPHMMALERPELVARVLKDFLS